MFSAVQSFEGPAAMTTGGTTALELAAAPELARLDARVELGDVTRNARNDATSSRRADEFSPKGREWRSVRRPSHRGSRASSRRDMPARRRPCTSFPTTPGSSWSAAEGWRGRSAENRCLASAEFGNNVAFDCVDATVARGTI
jgi:hypothetical protein